MSSADKFLRYTKGIAFGSGASYLCTHGFNLAIASLSFVLFAWMLLEIAFNEKGTS